MSGETNCPIREHTGDGAYVGRCDFGLRANEECDFICPRHGYLSDYPNFDDREVRVEDRRFEAPKSRFRFWRR